MKIITLDPKTFKAGEIITGYSSAIWTERFSGIGDFQIKVPASEENRYKYQLGDFLGLFGPNENEVMCIEDALVDEDDNKAQTMTITGRSFASTLERRTLWDFIPVDLGTPTVPQALKKWIEAKTRFHPQPLKNFFENGLFEVVTSVPSPSYGTDWDWEAAIEQGDLFATVKKLLDQEKWGIRGHRSRYSDTFGKEVPALEIYAGTDRTDPTSPDQVVFHHKLNHITKPTYLRSRRDFKTAAYVNSPLGEKYVVAPWASIDGGTSVSWFDFAALTVNSDVSDSGDLTDDQMLTKIGLDALAGHNRQFVMDGQISPKAPYVYKKHYNLGDRIRFEGPFGFSDDLIVSEFVRTDDADGKSTAYPTLTHVEDEAGS